ncbi:MAG: FtsQ-type POTRA domain-containing protein [Verrucomicrobia bacterium]|nr:FtsQ-type POTRA domain-containing protein [Verrucomicrobiota bacterium]
MSTNWTMKQALFCLIGSTTLTLVLSLGGYWGYKQWKLRRMTDEKCRIVAIVQTGPEKEALKTSYLAELLNLSADVPTQLYAFDLKKATAKLLSSPLISSVQIKRVPPGTLYIDYTVRKPTALLADYGNTAIDKEGFLFPVAPFFSPKQLPEIYLGLPPFGAPEDSMDRKGGAWRTPVKNKYLSLAFELLQFLEDSPWKEGMRIKRIDVSNAFAPSLGQREIVLIAEDELSFSESDQKEIVCIFPKILRLAPKDYRAQLGNFFSLRKTMQDDYRRQLVSVKEGGRFAPRIIDLRIPQLAFIDNR